MHACVLWPERFSHSAAKRPRTRVYRLCTLFGVDSLKAKYQPESQGKDKAHLSPISSTRADRARTNPGKPVGDLTGQAVSVGNACHVRG